MYHIIKNLKKDNTRVLSSIIFYENIKTVIFKVLGSIIYFIMSNYLCVYYMCLQEVQLYLTHKVLENTTFNYISGIGNRKLIMNIISCNGFVKNNKSTVIILCCIKLVSYYLSKRFVVINKHLSA